MTRIKTFTCKGQYLTNDPAGIKPSTIEKTLLVDHTHSLKNIWDKFKFAETWPEQLTKITVEILL